MTGNSLPKGWRLVKFGDLVRKVNNRVDPESSGISRYVAGEHMNSDNLNISRWGIVGDGYLGPAFTMRFQPGQVLYGSRRTYLRKVAVADFEGICANTTFVLETKSDDLLQEFLPHVMSTERFHTRSISKSKGSVNPYINFVDLNDYEFALPPIAQQRRMVELFFLIDKTIVSYEAIELGILESALVTKWLNDSTISNFAMDLKDLIQNGIVELGRGDVISKKDIDETPGDFPVYSSAQQDDGKIGSYGKYMFDEELITWSIDGGGYIFHRPKHKFSVTNIGGYLRILMQERISYQYLAVVLKELHRREKFDWQNKAHPSVLQKKYKGIPVPSIDIQNILVEKIASIQLLRSKNNLNVLHLKQIRKSFLSDLLR